MSKKKKKKKTSSFAESVLNGTYKSTLDDNKQITSSLAGAGLSSLFENNNDEEEDDILPFNRNSVQNSKLEYTPVEEDIAPVKKEKKEESNGWFKSGLFEDGYDFGDVTKTILGSGTDLVQNVTKGALNIGEGALDVATYGVSGALDLFGADETAEKVKKFGQKNLIEDWDLVNRTITTVNPVLSFIESSAKAVKLAKSGGDLNVLKDKPILSDKMDKIADKDSVFEEKSDQIAEGLGYVGGMAGLSAIGVPPTLTAFTTSMGNEMTEAFNNNASYGEAFTSGFISGVSEAGSEMLFGGLGKTIGKGALDDAIASGVSKVFKKQLTKNLAEFGIKSAGEGLEEIISSAGQELGRAISYGSEYDNPMEFLKDEKRLEEFVNGAIVSAISQSPSLVSSTRAGRSYVEGTTQNEQKVIDSVVDQRIKEAETDGTKLTNRQKTKIQEQVKKEKKKGYIDTDTIESVLGKNADISKDGYLQNSYREKTLKSQPFAYEVQDTDSEAKRKVYTQAMESGILNNTQKTHDFVDFVAKISEDRGTNYSLVNNSMLQEQGYALDGKIINGVTTKDGIAINVDSKKALNQVIGHETTHLLEGTKEYQDLKNSVFEYAKTKGDYDSKLKEITELYKNTNSNIDNELTSELVGDYLFTDQEFINNLSVEQPNIFKRMYNYVKHIYKLATAGSTEARQLEELKYRFDKAYKQSTKTNFTSKVQQSDIANISDDLKKEIQQKTKVNMEGKENVQFVSTNTLSNIKRRGGYRTESQIKDLINNIKSNGFVEPIELVRDDNGNITVDEGNHRLQIAEELGLTEVPVVYSDSSLENYNDSFYNNDNNISEIMEEEYGGRDENVENISKDDAQSQYIETSSSIDSERFENKRGVSGNDRLSSKMGRYNNRSSSNTTITENDTAKKSKQGLNSQDTKYSLSADGKMVDNKGDEVTLEATNTGNTNNLMAIHNISEEKLKGILELGGFPVPSIAIVDSSKFTHSQFGNISVLFDKETINPTNRLNEVYDRDVWSPTFPTVDVEIDNAKLKNISKESGIGNLRNDPIVNEAILNYFYEENLSDKIDRMGFEETLNKIKNDDNMKYAYLKANDNSFEPIMKARKFGNYPNDIYQAFLNSHEKLSNPMSMSYDEIMKYGKDVQSALKTDLDNKITELNKSKNDADKIARWTKIYTDEYNKIPENYSTINRFLQSAYDLQTNGSDATEIDQKATLEKASDTINQQEYDKWVDDNFNGIIRKKGIRNDKDIFTPSGNRRSFEQLHDDYTLNNIVKNMTKGRTQGGEKGFSQGFGSISANMATRFRTIQDIQNNKSRLDANADNIIEPLKENLSLSMNKLLDYYKGDKTSFTAYNSMDEAIFEFSSKNNLTEASLRKVLNDYYYDVDAIPNSILNDIITNLEKLKNIPSDYFEAKPQRAVGLDEVQAVVIPNNTDVNLKQQLSDRGLYVVEYDPKIENDRQNKINQFDDLKFSLSNQNEDIAPVNSNNVYGEDVRLQQQQVQQQVEEAIAPLQEKIQTLSENIKELTNQNITQEDIAPVPQNVVEEEAVNSLENINDIDAPINEGAFNFEEELSTIKGKRAIVNEIRDNFNIKTSEAREIYNQIAGRENVTVADVYNNLVNLKDRLGNSVALNDNQLHGLANTLYVDIGNNERYNGNQRHRYFLGKNINDYQFDVDDSNPAETYEQYLRELPEELDDSYAPFLEMAKEINSSDTNNEAVANELDRLNVNTLENPKIEQKKSDVFSEFLNNQLRKKRGQTVTDSRNNPIVAKQKSGYKTAMDTFQQLFVNENRAVDNLSKETKNPSIKYKGYMLSGVAGESQGDIYIGQTDNYGNVIGKSVAELWKPAHDTKLYDLFEDRMKHQLNIERWKTNKPLWEDIPAEQSRQIVKAYDETYPQFKDWAKDIYKFYDNSLKNKVEAGLVSKDLAKVLREDLYPSYVRIQVEQIDKPFVNTTPDEIRTKAPLKRAVGGSGDTAMSLEQAMANSVYADKKSIRQNQLYLEIAKTLKAKRVELGADVRTDPTLLEDALYLDADTGKYYLTAYENGERFTVEISKELYDGLNSDLKNTIKDLEQRFSLITKPLQKLSSLRRNMLTSYSPTFMLTNPLRDPQDAILNSNHPISFVKNLPKAWKEAITNTGDAPRFRTLYGSPMALGEYNVDSGLGNTDGRIAKILKNNRLARGIKRFNEVTEIATRLAEFKANLEHGSSVEEAMYYARESTVNFDRGGTITKALNRNGFTFLNASVQGFDKLIRNFSGENGARGFTSSLIKATMFGVVPAVFNHLMFGGEGDEKDEDYEALPDYIKDNYYLFKTNDGEFVRIPKGRMVSIFGSAGRRVLELMDGEEDAFEGYLSNAFSQVGVQNPLNNNIFAPLMQAINNETWYGTDLVPSRLQDKPAEEQFDETTDKLSIKLG